LNPRPTRFLPFPAAVAVLLAAATVQLRAELTLTLAGLPETVRAGENLTVRVQVMGADPGSPVDLLAWVKGRKIFELQKVLPGSAALTYVLPVPPDAAGSSLAVQARCTGQPSEPSFLRILAGDGDAPGAKRARVSPSAAAAPAASAPLANLPQALKARVAGFVHPKQDLAAVDQAWSRAAGEATDILTISGAINDARLERLLARCSRIRTIKFMDTPDLSAEGIVKALEPCTHLVTLINNGRKLKPTHIVQLARTHPSLVNLNFPPTEDIRDEDLAQLPDRIIHLVVRSSTLRDETVARFPHLQTLRLTGSRVFRGDRLPPGLRVLDAKDCPAFAPEVLPEYLTRLVVGGAAGFRCPIHLRHLKVLSLVGCPGVTRDLLLQAVKNARSLTSFQGEGCDAELIGALPEGVTDLFLDRGAGLADGVLARFKRLQVLHLYQCPGLTGALLPPGLKTLKALDCPGFQSEPLGSARLEQLFVDHCPRFTGLGCPESLRVLELSHCAETACANALYVLECLPRLSRLVLSGRSTLALPAPELLNAHPALTFCQLETNEGATTRWIRPQKPAAPPAGPPRS